jgi:hypothetical protein
VNAAEPPRASADGAGMRPARRRSPNWLWFFGVLVVLAVAWISGLYYFTRQQQLKPEQLTAAETLWKEKGPRSYDLDYSQKGSNPGEFQVQVRDGKVVAASRNGQALEKRLFPYYDMPALFGYIETFLEQDAQPGRPRTYTTARFDRDDGHLLRYVRRVMGSQEQVEITVQLKKVS